MNETAAMAGQRKIRVGLLWHSVNSENLGVVALTVSNMAIIEAVARQAGCAVEFVVMGWADPGAPQIEQDNLRVFRMRTKDIIGPRGLFRQCRQCDFVLDISAGDGFSDIYGPKRFALGALSRAMVLLARRPLVFVPQTIGPFKRGWVRIIAAWLMKHAFAVVTRDTLSETYIKTLGIQNAIESTDVAFRLPYETKHGKPPGKAAVGLNISGLLFNGGYTRDNMFSLKDDYPKMARELIAAFLSKGTCDVHLVSHVISSQFEVEDDYRTAVKLSEEFPAVIVAPRFNTPSEAKTYISGLDFFAGSRMHACIAAFSSGVPVVPIAYSRKF